MIVVCCVFQGVHRLDKESAIAAAFGDSEGNPDYRQYPVRTATDQGDFEWAGGAQFAIEHCLSIDVSI